MDRLLLLLSTLAFVAGTLQAVLALRAGTWREASGHWVLPAVGFAFQMAFLYLRGQQHQRCPITNVFEVLIFVGWGIVLLYLLVGSTFRLSLLGVFTAPMIALLQGVSLLLPLDGPAVMRGHPNAWNELHAALSLIAYSAFAMGCVTGIMLLVQERLLKRHRIASLFYQLPAIHELAQAITRLTVWGVLLLTVGIACSLKLETSAPTAKLLVSWAVWGLYVVIAALMGWKVLSSRRVAWLAVAGFAVPLVSLWLVTKG